MDAAHIWTDEQIAAMQARFHDSYETAAREMSESLEKWLEDYNRQNVEWQSRVEGGSATKRQYKEWLRQMSSDRTWQEDMIAKLTEDATNADKIAMDAINDELPMVYGENANYAAYDIDSKIGRDTKFTLYDMETVRNLLMNDPQLYPQARIDLPKDMAWNRRRFTNAITQGILRGESIPKMAKRLMRVIDADEKAATRAARTATTAAENLGRVSSHRRAKDLGIRLESLWIATLDTRTRATHRELDMQHVPVGERFKTFTGVELRCPGDPECSEPGEVYNCFVGDDLVTCDSEIRHSYRHEYSGKLLTVHTASGIKFTCTPNHPILTPSGWVSAKLLDQGDDLCIARVGNDPDFWGNPDIHHVMTSFKAVHELGEVLSSKRRARLNVNFHGDVPTSDVEIVGQEWLLGVNVDTSLGKSDAELLLELADSSTSALSAFGESFLAVGRAASGDLRSVSVGLSFVRGELCHPNIHGIRTVAPLNPCITENASNDVPRMADSLCDGLFGLPSNIGVDNVLSIEVCYARGTHVYNLQTGNGYYYVGSEGTDNVIIAQNCRCTMGVWTPHMDLENAERWNRLPEGMTYDEWKDGKSTKGEGHVAVDGKNLLSTWNSDSQGVDAIYSVIRAQGFDGMPIVADSAEFEKYADKANAVMVRGYMAPNEEVLQDYARQLRGGEWYVDCSNGGAVHGKGMYTFFEEGRTKPSAETLESVKSFSGTAGVQVGKVETMTTTGSFRSINEDDISKEFQRASLESIRKSYGDDIWKVTRWNTGNAVPDETYADVSQRVYMNSPEMVGKAMQEYVQASNLNGLDKGTAAALMGYDGIRVHVGGNTDYMVVLNRTKLVILDE